MGRASATLWWSDLGSACERLVNLPCPLQHYTSDADGLCTRLIKPKVMEGTVAAQDEFFRSEWHPILSLHLPACLLLPRLLGIAPSQRLWRPARVCTYDRPVGRGEPCCDSAPLSTAHCTPPRPPGGWALNMKDLKLLQTIGKGEFGGEQEGLGALRGSQELWGVREQPPTLSFQM